MIIVVMQASHSDATGLWLEMSEMTAAQMCKYKKLMCAASVTGIRYKISDEQRRLEYVDNRSAFQLWCRMYG